MLADSMYNGTKLANGDTYELWEGISGSGDAVWDVVTVRNGAWIWQERFTSKAEAESWMKWSA